MTTPHEQITLQNNPKNKSSVLEKFLSVLAANFERLSYDIKLSQERTKREMFAKLPLESQIKKSETVRDFIGTYSQRINQNMETKQNVKSLIARLWQDLDIVDSLENQEIKKNDYLKFEKLVMEVIENELKK